MCRHLDFDTNRIKINNSGKHFIKPHLCLFGIISQSRYYERCNIASFLHCKSDTGLTVVNVVVAGVVADLVLAFVAG